MSVLAKRLQTGLFEALASTNRAAGSGGGAGMGLALVVDQDTGSINQTFNGIGQANAVDITSSSSTFHSNRTSRYLILSQVNLANNGAGTTNTDFVYVYLDLDGTRLGGHAAFTGIGPQAIVATIVNAPLVGSGAHTVKLRGYVGAAGNVGILYSAETFVLALNY